MQTTVTACLQRVLVVTDRDTVIGGDPGIGRRGCLVQLAALSHGGLGIWWDIAGGAGHESSSLLFDASSSCVALEAHLDRLGDVKTSGSAPSVAY
ncbi:hypothetical protein AB4Z10_15535 [Bosea sp. RAF48]|uniref:hypothetical protein n=1 Tax=Bosea sp. RAF48 TaxID=3237480 RepID=UPI003F905C61